jgi:hypothetical protein
MAPDIVIEPIAVRHIESYHQALDVVARERRYLTFLVAPPLEDTRKFVLDMIENRHPQFVAVKDGEVVGGAISAGISFRRMRTGDRSAWGSSLPTADWASACVSWRRR